MAFSISNGKVRNLNNPAWHWNPGNKVFQDHRDGTIDEPMTNICRAARGLPVPWKPEMAEAETRMPDIA